MTDQTASLQSPLTITENISLILMPAFLLPRIRRTQLSPQHARSVLTVPHKSLELLCAIPQKKNLLLQNRAPAFQNLSRCMQLHAISYLPLLVIQSITLNFLFPSS